MITKEYNKGYQAGLTVARYINETIYKTVSTAVTKHEKLIKLVKDNNILHSYYSGKLQALKDSE